MHLGSRYLSLSTNDPQRFSSRQKVASPVHPGLISYLISVALANPRWALGGWATGTPSPFIIAGGKTKILSCFAM